MGNVITVSKNIILSVSSGTLSIRFSYEKLPHTGKTLREMKFTVKRDSVQTEEGIVSTLGFNLKSLAAKINEQAC